MSEPRKFRCADLYCAAGGAAMGIHRAGFEVEGWDINPQPHYPFKFHLGNALDADLSGFDAVWASPPCQRHTRKPAAWGRARNHVIDHQDLIGATRKLLMASGLPYILENVPGSKISSQLMLCGTMFGLRIIKHRYFESNAWLNEPENSCDHSDVYNPWQGEGRSAEKHRAAQGTPWIPMSGGASRKKGITGDVFNAIPPAYSEFLSLQIMKTLTTAPSASYRVMGRERVP